MLSNNIEALLNSNSARVNLEGIPCDLMREVMENMDPIPGKFFSPFPDIPGRKIRVGPDGGSVVNYQPWTTITLGGVIDNYVAKSPSIWDLVRSFLRGLKGNTDPRNFRDLSQDLRETPTMQRLTENSTYECSVIAQRTEGDPRHAKGILRSRTPFLLVQYGSGSISSPKYEISNGLLGKWHKISKEEYVQMIGELETITK